LLEMMMMEWSEFHGFMLLAPKVLSANVVGNAYQQVWTMIVYARKSLLEWNQVHHHKLTLQQKFIAYLWFHVCAYPNSLIQRLAGLAQSIIPVFISFVYILFQIGYQIHYGNFTVFTIYNQTWEFRTPTILHK